MKSFDVTGGDEQVDGWDPLIVATTAGRVRGVVRNGVMAFRAVPYAAPPVGPRRFRPANPSEPWADVRNCVASGPACPQLEWPVAPILTPFTASPVQDEDCLTLNIWTRDTQADRKRPVMIWLHGGGFGHWDGNAPVYDGTVLAQTDRAVVVTLNHRLNLFGFLYLAGNGHPDFADAANVGMTDIVRALHWVRDNIAAFGGDPNNVTLFGESGGSAKVATLLAMPLARGLFHRAIMQSGALVRGVTEVRAKAAAQALLDALGLSDPALLEDIPVVRLLEAYAQIAPIHARAFGPVVDGRTLPRHPCEPDAPVEGADIPLLIGCNADETSVMFGDPAQSALDWTALESTIRPFAGEIDPACIVRGYREIRPEADCATIFYAITNAIFFRMNVEASADRKAAQSAPVWRYELSWPSPVDSGKWGAAHTLDIPLVFGTLDQAAILVGDGLSGSHISAQMQAAWLAFAERGDPNAEELPQWPRYNAVTRATLRFDLKSGIVVDPYAAERQILAGVPLMSLTD